MTTSTYQDPFQPFRRVARMPQAHTFGRGCTILAALLMLSAPGAALAQVASYAFVPNDASNTVTVIETTGHTVVSGPIPTETSPRAAAVSPDGRRVYLLHNASVTIVDVATRTVIGSPIGVASNAVGIAITPDGRKAYTTSQSANSVSVIDLTTNTVIATVTGGGLIMPRHIAVAPDGQTAWVAANGLFPIDVATSTLGTPIATGAVVAIAVSPDGQTAYTTDFNGLLTVVDLTTRTIVGSPIAVGSVPRGIAFSPDGQVAYVTNNNSDDLSVIDVATATVVTTVAAGDGPLGVAFTPDGRYVYVTNVSADNVTVLDAATNTPFVGSPIAVGSDPQAHGGHFITPPIIVPAGGAFSIGGDGGLTTTGFGPLFIPFNGGTLRLTAPWTTTRHVSLLADGGIVDTNGFAATVAGDVVNDGTLTKIGAGTLILSGTSTHTGGSVVSAGTLAINGTHTAFPVSVTGGTLGGVGTVGTVTATSGALAPGVGPGVGTATLHAAQVTMAPAVTFVVELNGTVVGAGYDRLEVSGTAAINGAALSVVTTFEPPPTSQYTILTNATGTFAGLPEGAIVTSTAGRRFRVSYVGGDGNDVVLTADAPPSLSGLVDVTAAEDAGLVSVPFTIGDDFVAAAALIVTASSSDQAIVPNANLATNGAGGSRAVGVTTATHAFGTATIQVNVFDGVLTTSQTFVLTVNPVNDAPTISAIGSQSVPENTPLDPVAFTIRDVDDDAADLTIAATSSNQTVVPDASLTIGGAGAARTIAATPRVGVRGDTTITLTVSDGALSTTATFTLSVREATYYLAEGASGEFFDTDILLANPNAVAAPIAIRFLKEDGTSIVETRTLPPTSRTTIAAEDVAGLEGAAFSTIVTSTDALPLVVERTMRWGAENYGAHTEKATAGAAPTWYFAEGAQGFFSTYFLLANPHATDNTAHVTYFLQDEPAVARDYPLAPGARTTIDAGADAALRDRSFGARVTFDLPGVAERAMYFGASPLWLGGHASAGTTAPSTTWFLAEGATGSYFTTFLLLANPNDDPAEATVTYLPDTGLPVTRTYTIPGQQRLTRNIAEEDASLASAAVATTVTATRPIIVERAQYWGQPAWVDAHNSPGATAAGMRWGLAEGRVGGTDQAQTYILIANPGAETASVTITFLRTDGTTIVKTFTVAPTSRFNVAVAGQGSHVPELIDEPFGALLDSTQPIVVERSLYGNANGLTWATGTNATATRLP